MIIASPLAIQAMAYWRNSTRLEDRPPGSAAMIDYMNAHATMTHMAQYSMFPAILGRASTRIRELGQWRPVDAKVYAFPCKSDNPLIRRIK